ncbi:MAG: hypothetical protein AAF587_01180 [Bacteroidota bacterium]
MMRVLLRLAYFFLSIQLCSGQDFFADQSLEKIQFSDTLEVNLIQNPYLYLEGWDTLPQIQFWRKVISLDPDTSLLNIAKTRQIVYRFPTIWYDTLSREGQQAFKDSLQKELGVAEKEKLYVTYGKQDFYQLRSVIPEIHQAIPVFQQAGVNPWYAQAILLIESPGRLEQSPTGAFGPFQLMKYVARQHGLTVTSEVDERAIFPKAAEASARHFKEICIPETKKILRARGIGYDENALWFRLLVLHVYHAGATNVGGVMRKIRPTEGGMSLIRQLWTTRYRRFGNSSQNYSQVALATLLELDYIMALEGELICE